MQSLEWWFECKGTKKVRSTRAPGQRELKLQVQFCLVVKSTMQCRSCKFSVPQNQTTRVRGRNSNINNLALSKLQELETFMGVPSHRQLTLEHSDEKDAGAAP